MKETFAGVVLCGGQSRRMGRPKLSLPFGDETMLERVVRVLSEAVSPVVVVAARDQDVPGLPADVIVLRDEQEDLGPLGGLSVALDHLQGTATAAYVSSCDVPLLSAAFVRQMLDLLGNHDLAIPREEKFFHPLAAVYRASLADSVRGLIAANRLRPFFLVEESDANVVPVEELRAADPKLRSLKNVNSPEDYQEALQIAGIESTDRNSRH